MSLWEWIANGVSGHLAFTGLASGLGAVVGSFASGTWAVYRFRAERRERELDREKAEERHYQVQLRESQKPFLQEQLRLYLEITKIVAQVSVIKDLKDHPEIVQRFWELYWGELSIVETPEIEAQMKRIGDIINVLYGFGTYFADDKKFAHQIDPRDYKLLKQSLDINELQILPEDQNNSNHVNKNYIEYYLKTRISRLAYHLAHHVRRSIEGGWAVKLKPDNMSELEQAQLSVPVIAAFDQNFDKIMEHISRRDSIPEELLSSLAGKENSNS
jgi:hypothetical protein